MTLPKDPVGKRRITSRTTAFCLIASCVVSFSMIAGQSDLPAGTVELSGGGQLTGQVRKVQADKTSHVIVQVDDDLSVAVAGVHTRRTVPSSQLDEYRKRVIAAGQDADAHYELARWCKQAHMLHQFKHHLARTIDLAPDHPNARSSLGYVKNERGDWISYEGLRRSQGLVQDRSGRWVLPEVLFASNQEDEYAKAAKIWIKNFTRLRSRAVRGDAEAIAEIEAINDPLATNAIARELELSRGKKTQSRQLRLTYVKLLGSFHTSPAVKALVETGLVEPDMVVREEALRQLTLYGASSAVASYLPMLKSAQPRAVKSAARALSYFPDPELAFEYIDALITTQTKRTQVGSANGGTQAGFSNNGTGGFSAGGKVVESKIPVRHAEALSLLRAIAPGVDYGYDKQAWRLHFARLRSPTGTDLRRDL